MNRRHLGNQRFGGARRNNRVQRTPRQGGPLQDVLQNGLLAVLTWAKDAAIERMNQPSEPPETPSVVQRTTRASAIRVAIVGAVFLLVAAAIVGRSVQLQILEGERYSEAARRQAVTSARITAKRGIIKDRAGAELAISVDVDSIYAEPKRIQDPDDAAAKLAPILGVPRGQLLGRLASDKFFVYLARRVTADAARRVRELQIAGIGTRPEPRRFYTNRDLAAHVLGFTSGEGTGQSGIEKSFDQELRGKSFEMPGLRDALGKQVFSEGFVPQAVLEGDDLVLTIERHIQHAAEVELEKAVTGHEALGGVAIVMRPSNGEILALASYPTFNPNNLKGASPNQQLNRAVSAAYEPGSTMKMITIAAALEEQVVSESQQIDCEGGRWRVGGRTIGDANHKYGLLTIGEIMKVSSNICAAKIGIELGRERLHRWLTRFGFGAPTGIELPGELKGVLRAPQTWREITLANVAFGQGMTATPIQILRAAGVIASGGMLVDPHLLAASVDKTGARTPAQIDPPRRVLSANTAAALTRMMNEVTRKGGTAPQAAVPGFEVAGKTGTAQKVDPVSGAYSHSLLVVSFVGFVPADRPEIVALVIIDEPKKGGVGGVYGGTIAGPAFRGIAMAALSALEVYPEDEAARQEFMAAFRAADAEVQERGEVKEPVVAELAEADMTGPSAEHLSAAARALLGGSDLKARRGQGGHGDPEAWDRALPPGEEEATDKGAGGPREPSDRPEKEKEGFRMPNFAGLPLHLVLNRAAEVHCDLVLKGTGRVVRQKPLAGAPIKAGVRCELELSTEWNNVRGSKT